MPPYQAYLGGLIYRPKDLRAGTFRIRPFRAIQINFKFQDYNTSINPTFSNAVGVAAFRFGHSQIRNSLSRY